MSVGSLGSAVPLASVCREFLLIKATITAELRREELGRDDDAFDPDKKGRKAPREGLSGFFLLWTERMTITRQWSARRSWLQVKVAVA